MSRLKTNRNLATRRPRCFLGAVIGAVGSIASSIIGSNAQKRERRRQERAQDYTNMLETAKSDSAAMNSMLDYNRNYLSQFNTVARLGTSKRSKLNSNIFITDGGDAVKIDKDTYLLRGGSHEQTNETGQTGIGINVGGNEIEAEGGEVAQKRNGALRIFSAQPILGNGMSPAQAILRGYNKDKVFNAQQRFKKNNDINDDGTKQYRPGGEVPYNHYDSTGLFGGDPHPLAKMIDVTGITSWGDVKKLIDKKKRGEIPTTQEYLSALSAIPAIGRIPKIINTIGNIADAASFMEDVRRSEAKEEAYQNEVVKYMDIHGKIKTGKRGSMPASAHELRKRLGGRIKARIGGSWTAPVYNTNKYRVSNRMRRQIATWEGSDFAGQNRKFKGDAIGAKERELRQMMGRTYNYLNDNQRDSLNSIYYNSRVDTFKNNFNKWFRNLNDAVDRGDERAFNNSLAGIRQSMTTGANRKGMSGLAKRRAWEQDWFGNPIPMDSNETKAILKQQADARMIQPVDNTRIVIQPQYIEVPTPVGHGIIPVDNPNPNLLQGNIKDNLINMGTKFRLGQRCGGSTRVRKALGGESRPVKGMRRKLAWGDVTYPYRRNNDFDYWTAINQEQKANDKGGITPWTTSNKYDVTPPLAITKTTPTIPYQNVVTPVTTKSKEDNGGSNNKSTNKLGATFKNVDWASLGADLIGTIGAGIIGAKTAGNIYIPDAPVRYQASKLDTNYNIVPQLETIRRSRNRLANEVAGNTSSSVAALNRLNLLENNANEQLNKLYDIKENRESELLNQDALNQQSVSAQNVQAMNDYNYRVAELKNLRTQGVGNVLSGTLQGIGNSFQNFFSQGRQNYDDTQAMLMGVAASDYATPSRLLELGVDVGDDAALAGIYHSAMNIPNPGARPKREDYSDNTEYSYALTRWENQNKAYQRRNSYADLIKGRMNRKNLSKYGII